MGDSGYYFVTEGLGKGVWWGFWEWDRGFGLEELWKEVVVEWVFEKSSIAIKLYRK